MGELLLLVAVFMAGGLAGAGLTWWFIGRSRPVAAHAPMTPPSTSESEVGQLASASRQLITELETRYQGRTAGDGEPKRNPTRRRRKS